MKIFSVEEEAAAEDFEDSEDSEDSEELAQDPALTEVPIAKTLDDVSRRRTTMLSFGSLLK